MKKPILCIDSWSSTCLNCSKHADPMEKSHEKELGYGKQGKGCGITWTHVTTGYRDAEESTKKMRPDLKFIDFFEQNSI